MLDFHSHILPEIDDGAQSVEESVVMLKMLKEQGVKTIALTSHYIAMDESPDAFLQRREQAYEILKAELEKEADEMPKLLLGAEVYYYPNICKMDELSKLTLSDTGLLLLEMPMAPWGEYTIKEITDLVNSTNIQVVIAHIERAIKYQKKDTIQRLIDNGVLMQVNASFFITKSTRRKALKMLKNDQIHFIGSDCHNVKYRPPKIDEALSIIENKFSKEFVNEFIANQNSYLVK
ncbi:MAG: hypothetical protein IJD68_07660 [Ruminococcus sp.]|nr:hypothetical protein [Ruminococcus sp.]